MGAPSPPAPASVPRAASRSGNGRWRPGAAVMRRRLPVFVAAAVVLVATSPNAALAADVTMPGPSNDVHMTYTALPGESNDVTLESSGDRILLRQFGRATPLRILAMGDCILDDTSDPKVLSCAATGITQLVLTLGDGDDDLTNTTAWTAQASGEGGDDILRGGGGNEQLEGGAGADNVDGGSGNDRVYGPTLQNPGAGTDSDVLAGSVGDDLLIASGGADRLDGGPGVDQLQGGDGPDGLMGGAGNDSEDGGAGDDMVGTEITPGVGQDLGNDALSGGPGNDTLTPGPGSQLNDADTISGGDGFDRADYGTRIMGVDVSKNGAADDGGMAERDNVGFDVERISGGLASDRLVGGPDPDTLEGGPGDDRVEGLEGDDMLLGDAGTSAGSDSVSGGPGNDKVQGEGDRDTLWGGPDRDELLGGSERDVVAYRDGADVSVRLDRDTGTTSLPGDSDRILEVEDVTGDSRRDTLDGANEPNTLEGFEGADYVDGRGGRDRLDGGGSADVVAARDPGDGTRDELVSCGPGPDFAIVDRRDRPMRRGGNRCERVDNGSQRRPRPGQVYVEPQACNASEDEVEFGLPAMHRLVPLRYSIMLPSGYKGRQEPTLGAGDCTVRLTATPERGRIASADVSGAALTVAQTPGRRVTSVLTIKRPRCATGARNAAAAARGRRLRVRTRRRRGRWKVEGRYSTAASYATDWITVEGCDSTTTIVRKGRVRVRDRVKQVTVTVRAGGQYISRAPRSPD